ncbi:MAG: hypothetical protein ACXWHI_07875, partial [Candidatus Aminicenantales bacterium]
MAASFFDKIKLFKAAEILPGHTATEPPEEEPPQTFLRRLLKDPWPLLLLTTVLVALLLTHLPSETLTNLVKGEIAPADVVAPFDLTIEDAEATALQRKNAEAAILPVYTYDANVFAITEEKIRRLFAEGRNWTARFPEIQQGEALRRQLLDKQGVDLEIADVMTLVRLKFPTDLEETLISLVAKTFSQGIIVSKNLFIHGEAERGIILVDE